MIGRMRRLLGATVWARGGVRPEDRRFRGIFRYVLPLTDVLFLYFGVVGWHNGIRSVEQATGDDWQTWWSLSLAVAAFVALVGVSFPRLWLVELAGKIPLITLVTVYVWVMLGRGLDDPKVTATAGLVVILILLPVWRVVDLAFVSWAQKRGDL
jgi:hypothetical protein